MPARSRARQQLYTDIVTTAIEGGINYWACVSAYKWGPHDFDDKTTVPFARATIHDQEDGNKTYEVDVETISRAFGLLRKGGVKGVADESEWRRRMLEMHSDIEDADYDASDAEALVQLGLFGEVIYA